MEYYNVVANYTGRLTLMYSGKFNNSLEKSRNFIIKQSGNPAI